MDSLNPSVPTVGLSTPAQLTAKIPSGGLNNIQRNNNDNNDNGSPNNTTEKKKKKRKKRSKTSKLPEAGSEITEDYKEKYDEDAVEDPYDPSRSLARRIEYAIWKYKRNHRFTEENRAIFDDYLKFGGVSVGPNAFLGRATGGDSAQADANDGDVEVDFEAAKAATATIEDEDFYNEEDELEDGVYISFSEVAQIYLGNKFLSPHSLFISLSNHQQVPKMIDAFLRYLEIRNVAPEYKEDIAKARHFVELAKEQLVPCKKVKNLLPGAFNSACHTLFQGKLLSNNIDDDDNEWLKQLTDPKARQLAAEFMGLSTTDNKKESTKIKEAKKLVTSLWHNNEKDLDNIILKKEDLRLWAKIKDIQPYSDYNNNIKYYKVTLIQYDRKQETTLDDQLYDLYFEEEIKQELILNGVVHFVLNQLSNGQWYLKTSFGVYPTFYMRDQFDENDYID
ncbi:Argonaute complex, subunit Arb1 [Cunninghamella echinulata]|nr:Argonaute complex, subunit Arb1 [Cunninghamella echinulata]